MNFIDMDVNYRAEGQLHRYMDTDNIGYQQERTADLPVNQYYSTLILPFIMSGPHYHTTPRTVLLP